MPGKTKPNLIVLSIDEMRPDHLGCYGHATNQTPAIDAIAANGLRLESCFSPSPFTPVAMGSVLTGRYPNAHGMRDPYSVLKGETMATLMKKNGYATAGFVGNGILTRKHGFARGFDYWSEPGQDDAWASTIYDPEGEEFFEGKDWVEECLGWIRRAHGSPFFIWGHYYETHGFSEGALLRSGRIDENADPANGYYDAKIEMMDRTLIAPLVALTKELGIFDDTVWAVMSDHGTNLGEKPAEPLFWRPGKVYYPQHTTVFDFDLRCTMIVKAGEVPSGKVLTTLQSSIDLFPSLVGLLGVEAGETVFDGDDFLGPSGDDGARAGREIYAEDLFEPRGEGRLQALRSPTFKFIRNLTRRTEAFYDLVADPKEDVNCLEKIPNDVLDNFRNRLDRMLVTECEETSPFSRDEIKSIRRSLESMGYRTG